jgi:sirohydrochlorin ferrochelatase
MSAPALIALAHGSHDPRSARTVGEIVTTTKRLRPDLHVEAAFLDHNGPDLRVVVDRMVEVGHTELTVVPLLLASAYHARADVPAAVGLAQARHPGVGLRLAEVVGSDPSLLTALDQRLLGALQSGHLFEPDALVLASAGSTDSRANATISQLAQLWGEQHHLPASVAFSSAAPPSPAEAVREWRRKGRRRVAVGSLFIAPGRLPDRVKELALEAGAIAVTEPLGAHVQLSRLILARYSVGAATAGVLV